MSKRDLIVLLHRAKMEAVRASARHYLIKHGFKDDDVNSKKRIRWGTAYTYPIHMAAKTLDEAMVRTLLKLGADVKATDSSGRTASECLQMRLSGSCLCSGHVTDQSAAARILDLLYWKADPDFARYSLMPKSPRANDGPSGALGGKEAQSQRQRKGGLMSIPTSVPLKAAQLNSCVQLQ